MRLPWLTECVEAARRATRKTEDKTGGRREAEESRQDSFHNWAQARLDIADAEHECDYQRLGGDLLREPEKPATRWVESPECGNAFPQIVFEAAKLSARPGTVAVATGVPATHKRDQEEDADQGDKRAERAYQVPADLPSHAPVQRRKKRNSHPDAPA